MTPGLEPTALLRSLFDAAVAAAAPGPAVRRALERVDLHSARRIWILALGKAAQPMAAAAVEEMAAHGVAPYGGIMVPPAHVPPPHGTVLVFPGEHPVPGPGSLAAAEAIGAVAERAERGDLAIVLLSGGASSLAAAPVGSVEPRELVRLHELLLGSGLDITRMNIVRKRFSRWGAGRLAVALAPARVLCLAVSDVPGDDPAAIGSGPCVPDPTTAPDVARVLREARLLAIVPESLCTHLSAVEQGVLPETPKPGDAAFERATVEIVGSNARALEGAITAARAAGLAVRTAPEALAGEAAERGASIARALLEEPAWGGGKWELEVHGGETTVTLRDAGAGRRAASSAANRGANGASGESGESGESGARPLGGRSQELALAAARVLHEAGDRAEGIVLLAAGTDGRDGPTDAAGAIVDRHTWSAIRAAGREPARDLARHDAHRALDAAGALLRTGATGTNVMDVVFTVRSRGRRTTKWGVGSGEWE